MAALHLAAQGRDYLMWCHDEEFDNAVASLDMRGLVELVHTLQDAMAVEQQTFESLTKQLEQVEDPLLQQRMSAALCTSQTRLARLCSRNMRCFTQQALKSRQRDHPPTHTLDSRSSSPRDSGLAVSSSGSDFEIDLRGTTSVSPPVSLSFPSYGGASFKNSLAFFQRAANLVSTNTRNTSERDRHRDSKRTSKRHSSGRPRQNEDSEIMESSEENRFHCVDGTKNLDVELNKIEDHETYEQVLFINGRPQYKDDLNLRSHSFDALLDSRNSRDSDIATNNSETTTIHIRSDHNSRGKLCSSPCPDRRRSSSWTRVQIRPEDSSAQDVSVDCEPLYRSLGLSDATHSKSLSDVTTCISLPRRKPVLNFGSVSDDRNDKVNGFSAGVYNNFERIGYRDSGKDEPLRRPCTITRSHSFKEGLDFANDSFSGASPLSRTQSCYDGLACGFRETDGVKRKLSRAPSVDEILESVKNLRAKRNNMVRSSPDLLQTLQEKNYHSSSRHKSSKSKSSKNSSNSSSISGVRYSGSSSVESKREKHHNGSEYERAAAEDRHYYENINRGNQYENLPAKKVEVVYDSPKSVKVVEKRRHITDAPVDHYENVSFDPHYYENVNGSEPTYMNVGEKTKRKSKTNNDQLLNNNNQNTLYANIEEASQKSKTSLKKNRSGKVVVVNEGNSTIFDDSQTYDVPKATHIYDTPPKQTRQVRPQSTSKRKTEEVENEYDTPLNNRSVIPESSQILLKTKNEQIKKIDDIFADCENDSLEEDVVETSPDIPPPDYGSEEDDLTTEVLKSKPISPSADYIDEGLGESDSRSYYADEQGLEVILEEPEDDYCSSHSSEDDLRRRVDLQLRLKGERRSLDGSEGIGSAEGDCPSSGSELGGEEDCASSGVHSEDTSSPGPPPDHCKGDPSQLPPPPPPILDVSKDVDDHHTAKKEEDRVQLDRCLEIYPETLRQRQRNMAPSPSKVDIKNWEPTSAVLASNEEESKGKKFLPSVKALRNQFENGKPVSRESAPSTSPPSTTLRRTSSSSSSSSLVLSSLDTSSGFGSLTSSQTTIETASIHLPKELHNDEPVEPIFSQFKGVDEELRELMSKPPSTAGWNPQPLLKRLYYIPEAPKMHSQGTTYVNIEGYLEKLPSGRKKATFWNAWKRRFFAAKDGILYYYQNNQTEKPSMKLPLMGGKIEIMEPNMISVDDGKGHYVVVRCSSRQEAERWKRALETHTVDDFSSQYVQPWPRPTNPTLLRDTLVIDIGSCSVRAGVLASQATLPQLFFPSVLATNRETRRQIWGTEALMPDVRSVSNITFPIRPSHKISKFSVDLTAVSSLLQKTFNDLKVDPKNYNIQLSVPRILNPHTQAELLKILFDTYGVKSVNLTHQSILALYAYNATSGIVVDIGERMDVVPVIDGYIVDGGVSRVPYGGYRIMDHLRQFLFQRNVSLVNEVESYVIRQVLETVCYCAQHYNAEKMRCTMNPENFEKSVSLSEFFPSANPQFDTFQDISLEFGRFQATEGLFNPDAWGLDHPGLHKLVHKAIQECSMDIRKEMSRSIFLTGGVTQLPGIAERLTIELDNLTPPAIRPKVHSSPYRYHAAYLGACVLAESPAFAQSKITKEEWQKQGNSALGKWSL